MHVQLSTWQRASCGFPAALNIQLITPLRSDQWKWTFIASTNLHLTVAFVSFLPNQKLESLANSRNIYRSKAHTRKSVHPDLLISRDATNFVTAAAEPVILAEFSSKRSRKWSSSPTGAFPVRSCVLLPPASTQNPETDQVPGGCFMVSGAPAASREVVQHAQECEALFFPKLKEHWLDVW